MSEPRLPALDPARPHLVVLLSRGAGAYRRAIRERLRQAGFEDLPRSGSWLLATLSRTPGTVGELAVRLSTTKQGVSRLSDSLVERGYLRRSFDSRDHRLVRLALTPRGRSAAKSVFAAVAEVDRTLERRAGRTGIDRAEQALQALLGVEEQS